MADRIDHATEARQHIDWTHEWQEREGDTTETQAANPVLALAHATLALVEQQRIANLIALEDSGISDGAHQALTGPWEVGKRRSDWKLRPEVAAALGIDQ